MFRYYFQRFICSAAAIAMGLAIVVFLSGVLTASLFRSTGFIKVFTEKHEAEIVATVDESIANVSAVTGIPAEAYHPAYTGSNFNIISAELARDFTNGYSIDFSENLSLYNAFSAAISEYAGSNGLELDGDTTARNASYAVDAVSNALAGNDPTEINILRMARAKTIVYAFIAAAVVIVAAAVLLEVLNDGRHRKYNYIGMGIVIGGYVLTFVPLFIKIGEYVDAFRFCRTDIYNTIFADELKFIVSLFLIAGAIVLAAGIVMLIKNYNYYRKKNEQEKIRRETDRLTMNDFLEDTTPKKPPKADGEDFEREITKVDFDKY